MFFILLVFAFGLSACSGAMDPSDIEIDVEIPDVKMDIEILDISTISSAVGDGIADDTVEFQNALTVCSTTNSECLIPANTSYRITGPVYMWGGAHLRGESSSSTITLETGSTPYVFNFGIGGVQDLKPKWTGSVSHVTFLAADQGTGRILFPWRAEDVQIHHNVFDLGHSTYGPVSSGNNNNIVINGFVNCIRKTIQVTDNIVIVSGTNTVGSEGFGLNLWDGAVIARNTVLGAGDDMIGIHFSKNIEIRDNYLEGVDGRLFVANSSNVSMYNNYVARVASPYDGMSYVGIALIYIGHEGDQTHGFTAPKDITVIGNTLVYMPGSVDTGSAIYVYGPRNVTIAGNLIRDYSLAPQQAGIYILPYVYTSGTWTDPDGLDTDNVSRVYDVSVYNNNISAGTNGLRVRMTGQTCAYYVGTVSITNNIASDFSFICNPINSGNVVEP